MDAAAFHAFVKAGAVRAVRAKGRISRLALTQETENMEPMERPGPSISARIAGRKVRRLSTRTTPRSCTRPLMSFWAMAIRLVQR